MAGTAAGMAKATAARMAKRAAQRKAARKAAYVEYLGREPEPDRVTVSATVPAAAKVPQCMALPQGIENGGKALAVATLEDGAAYAAMHLVNLVRRGRVPHLIRFQAACKVLDLSLNRKGPAGPAEDDSRMAALLDRVASALALRRAAAGASDAIPAGEVTGDTDGRRS